MRCYYDIIIGMRTLETKNQKKKLFSIFLTLPRSIDEYGVETEVHSIELYSLDTACGNYML